MQSAPRCIYHLSKELHTGNSDTVFVYNMLKMAAELIRNTPRKASDGCSGLKYLIKPQQKEVHFEV
jgi:hypothetical protein